MRLVQCPESKLEGGSLLFQGVRASVPPVVLDTVLMPAGVLHPEVVRASQLTASFLLPPVATRIRGVTQVGPYPEGQSGPGLR
jgi:hypothetical protein